MDVPRPVAGERLAARAQSSSHRSYLIDCDFGVFPVRFDSGSLH
jgi:hypothetical protein